MGRSKLRVALAAEKGTDFKKLKEKKKAKANLKEKQKKAVERGDDDEEDDEEDEDWEDEEEDDEEDDEDEERNALIDDEASEDEDEDEEDDEELGADFIAAMDDSDDSDSDVEMEAKIQRPKKEKKAKTDDNTEGNDDELAWSDVDEEERAGLVVRQRQTINNTAALTAALLRIRTFAPTDASVPFQLHQSVTAAVPTTSHPDGTPMDMSDDKVREQALYSQSLAAAVEARRRLRKEGVPFSRPTDYFAEMLKDDGHMAQVKAKLVEAATAQKASAEARKQRDLKKFGKKVQVEKMQERQKEKKETLEKIKSLKRKRSEFGTTSTHESDAFDVAIDKELSSAGPGAKGRGGKNAAGGVNAKRQKKNEKYGFGGKKRHSKSGDAISSGDLSGFNARKMKAGGARKGGAATRPGKARRKAAAGKR